MAGSSRENIERFANDVAELAKKIDGEAAKVREIAAQKKMEGAISADGRLALRRLGFDLIDDFEKADRLPCDGNGSPEAELRSNRSRRRASPRPRRHWSVCAR